MTEFATNREEPEPPANLATRRYRVTIRALPDEIPPYIRLKRAIKFILRSFGLRVEAIEEL